MQYSKTVTEHFLNPKNVGEIEDADGKGEVGSDLCGDRIKLTLSIGEGKIRDAKFRSYGCGATIAACSAVTVWLIGKTVCEAMKLDSRAILGLLDGLPPEKLHCSMLAEEAVRAALLDHLRRNGAEGACAGGCGGDCAACAACAQTAGEEGDGHGEA